MLVVVIKVFNPCPKGFQYQWDCKTCVYKHSCTTRLHNTLAQHVGTTRWLSTFAQAELTSRA